MDNIRVATSKVDLTNPQKPLRKSRSKVRTNKNTKDGSKPDSSVFKSAWGFLSGLYGNSNKIEGLQAKLVPKTVEEFNGEMDIKGDPSQNLDANLKHKSQSETFADVLASSTDNQGDSFRNDLDENIFDIGSRQTSFAIAQRPSGILPRQTSSGINAILLDAPRKAENLPFEPEIHTVTTNHIRCSYDKPEGSPLPPLRLTNIFQNRLEEGSKKIRGPAGILNRAFFESVNDQIRKIKSKPKIVPSPLPEKSNASGNASPSIRRDSSASPPISNRKDSNGNVNINLTVQLGQAEGHLTSGDIGEISIESQNRKVIIDARSPLPKVENCMQTDVELIEAESMEILEGTNEEGDETDADDVSGALNKALEYTSDSLRTAFTIVKNLVPLGEMKLTKEEMNANEGDLPIILMRLMGIPQEMRHKIYIEACDEVEVLQDVTSGTVDALSTVLGWVIGGSSGRKDLMKKTRAICSIHSEVDMDSEIWHKLQQEVAEITETMEYAINDGIEKAQSVSKSCSETNFVASNVECMKEEDDANNNSGFEQTIDGVSQTYSSVSNQSFKSVQSSQSLHPIKSKSSKESVRSKQFQQSIESKPSKQSVLSKQSQQLIQFKISQESIPSKRPQQSIHSKQSQESIQSKQFQRSSQSIASKRSKHSIQSKPSVHSKQSKQSIDSEQFQHSIHSEQFQKSKQSKPSQLSVHSKQSQQSIQSDQSNQSIQTEKSKQFQQSIHSEQSQQSIQSEQSKQSIQTKKSKELQQSIQDQPSQLSIHSKHTIKSKPYVHLKQSQQSIHSEQSQQSVQSKKSKQSIRTEQSKQFQQSIHSEQSLQSVQSEQPKQSIRTEQSKRSIQSDQSKTLICKPSSYSHKPQQSMYTLPHHFIDPETSFLYNPHVFRKQLQNPVISFGPSEANLNIAKSERFPEEDDEMYSEMMNEMQSNQRTLCEKLNDEVVLPKVYEDENINNNIVPQEQTTTVENCEIMDGFVGVIGRLSKSFLPHFISTSDKNQKDLDQQSDCVTEILSKTSSVDVCASLGNIPRVPPNSEVIFEKIKNDKKVLEDLTRLQELVQELYDNVTPLASKASIEDAKTTDSEFEEEDMKNIDSFEEEDGKNDDSEFEEEKATAVSSTTTYNSAPTECSKTKSKRSGIPVRVRETLPSSMSKSTKSSSEGDSAARTSTNISTVSIYQSQRSSIGQKSILAIDNPIGFVKRNPSMCSQLQHDENNNNLRDAESLQSLKSTASSSVNGSQFSRPSTTGRMSITKRNFIKENRSSVTSTIASTGTATTVSKRSSKNSSAVSSCSIFSSSKTSQSTGYSESRTPVVLRKTAKIFPVAPSRQSSVVSTNSSYRHSRSSGPSSYQQILSLRKDYKAIAQKYLKLKSDNSSGSKNSNVASTATSTSTSSSSSKRRF